jgi:small-conductance mechanosensitive channel
MTSPGRITPVDLQEKRQHDLAGQVARVKKRARPWRSIIAAVLAVLAGVISYAARRHSAIDLSYGRVPSEIIGQAAAVAFCLFAVIAILGLAGKAREVLEPLIGTAHAAVIRYAILLTAGTGTLLITLDLGGVPVGQLALGGAVTGILIGIAGQQSLANVFAGIVLLLSRPFGVGDSIRLRSGALGGQLEGVVHEIGITYLRLDTPDGVLHLPNAQVLAAAVGPAAKPTQTDTVAKPAQASTVAKPAQASTVAKPAQASTVGGQVPSASAGPLPGSAGSPASIAGPPTGSAGTPDGGQPPGVP